MLLKSDLKRLDLCVHHALKDIRRVSHEGRKIRFYSLRQGKIDILET